MKASLSALPWLHYIVWYDRVSQCARWLNQCDDAAGEVKKEHEPEFGNTIDLTSRFTLFPWPGVLMDWIYRPARSIAKLPILYYVIATD